LDKDQLNPLLQESSVQSTKSSAEDILETSESSGGSFMGNLGVALTVFNIYMEQGGDDLPSVPSNANENVIVP
jgi:hypothetical protein